MNASDLGRALASGALHVCGAVLAGVAAMARAGGRLPPRGEGDGAPGLDLLVAVALRSPATTRGALAWFSLELAWVGPRRQRSPWAWLWVRSAPAAERLLRAAGQSPQALDVARALARWDPDLVTPALSPERAPGLLRHFEHDWGLRP